MNYSNITNSPGCGGQQAGNRTDFSSVFTKQVLPVLYALICAGGLVLNGLAAWIFFRMPSNSGLVVYLKNMVVADLLMLLSFPWRVASDLGIGDWQMKLVVCRYTAVLFYLSMYTGIAFMSLISLERFVKIVYGSSSSSSHLCSSSASSLLQRVPTARVLAFVVWALLLICMLPNTLLTNRPAAAGCSCMDLKSELGRRWHAVSAHLIVAIFWLTLVLMAYCYTSIAWHVYRSYRRVNRTGSEAGRKSNRSIFSLLAVFFLCFVPYHVCRVPYTLSQLSGIMFSMQTRYQLFQAKEATLFLSAFNVCLDPVIYFLMCRTFRESLLRKLSTAEAENRRPSVTNRLSYFHWMSTMATTNLTTALSFAVSLNTTTATSSTCVRTEVPAHPFFIFAYCLVCLVSLALNAITMRVYFCSSQRLRSSVTVYLKNLAAADFFLCLCLPLRIANYASKSLTMRRIYCNFGATAFYFNMYASILFMDYIAANRYLKIVRPLETHTLQTARAARYISIATWVSLSGIASVYLIVFLCTSWTADPIPGVFGCEALHSSKVNTLYKVIHSISAIIFIVVLVSLVLLYWGTVRRLQQTQKGQAKPCNHKLNKSKRNMLVLVVVFCVCFVPYHLVRLPYAFLKPLLKHCATAHAFYIVKELTVLLSVLNACLDPLIYFIFCKAFRAHLGLKSLHPTSSWKLSDTPGDMRRQSNPDTRGFHSNLSPDQ
ncbi:hypothetical protein NFI96_014163 [Prochilodus magdalenae]|nr:hypothetical protein NFI96_014163 [Prochilodus magdalenae]